MSLRKILYSGLALCCIVSLALILASEPDVIAEAIDKTEGPPVTMLVLQVNMYDSYDDLAKAFPEYQHDDYQLEGTSHFLRGIDETGWCEVNIVEPQEVDDEHTLTLGHEVLHCVYGLYHD